MPRPQPRPTLAVPRRGALAALSGALVAGWSAGAAAAPRAAAKAAPASKAAADQPAALRVAVEGAYPPFNKVDAKGKWTGFDVEIAQALCAAMGTPCKLVQQPWDRMIDDLEAGRYEMVVSSMSITEARRQRIDFSDPYYRTPAKFVGRSGQSLDAALLQLKGKRVAVQKATNHELYLSSVQDGVVLVRQPTLGAATADLAAGKADLVFGDAMALDLGFLKTPKGKGFAFVGPDMRDPRFFGKGMAVAVRKGNDDLRGRLNRALASIKASGAYDAIQKRYFVFDMGR